MPGGGGVNGAGDRTRGGQSGGYSSGSGGGTSLVEQLNALPTAKATHDASFWNALPAAWSDSAPAPLQSSISSLRGFFGTAGGDIEMQSSRYGGSVDAQQGLQDEMSEYLNMSYSQRLMLFAACFAGGVAMLVLAGMMLPMIVLRPAKFALAFTFGNLLCLGSTAILVGVRAQLSAMFHSARAVAAYLYLGALLVTLLSCFFGGSLRYLLVLASIVAEILAMIWYALSYIPYARSIISSFIPGLF